MVLSKLERRGMRRDLDTKRKHAKRADLENVRDRPSRATFFAVWTRLVSWSSTSLVLDRLVFYQHRSVPSSFRRSGEGQARRAPRSIRY
jgi:hypothetical protein